jgi:segregation and condensation protein A
VSYDLAARSRVATPVDLQLDLDVFDGPFDLLITLILKEEIDLWEVRVSRIIAEYVLQLAEAGEFDLEATSQFVVLIAALLEMKSRLLLEERDDGPLDELDAEEAGEQLLAALVRYGQFRGAADALRRRWAAHAGRRYRQVAIPARFLRRPTGDQPLPAALLADGLAVLLREPPLPDVSHITDLAVTLVRELGRLRALLADEESFTFSSVAPRDRLEKAVTFFALLELHNCGEVRLHQQRAFGEITVRRAASQTGAEASALVAG